MKNKKILIFGSGSDIAIELIKLLEKNNTIIKISSKKNSNFNNDNNREFYSTFQNYETVDNIIKKIDEIDLVIIFNGMLKSSKEKKFEKERELNNINFLYPTYIISKIIDKFENKKIHIAAISSVAGERGRFKNTAYGSNKAALTNYLSSIRQKYSNIDVTTIILGTVKTKMTKEIKQPKFLIDDPNDVARMIFKGLSKKKEIIISNKWRLITFFIKIIPEKIFKRLKF